MSGGLPLLVLCVLALLLAGCGGGSHTLLLADWTMTVASATAAEGATPTTPVHLPAHLDGALPSEPSRFTLRAAVDVPPDFRGRPLTLLIPQLWARTSLVANGMEAAPLDADETDGYRGDGSARFRIPGEISARADGRIALELRVEHAWTQSAWLDTVPRLSATPHGDAWGRFVRLFNRTTATAAGVTILVVFFSYLILYILDRRDSAYGWFLVEALAGCLYPAFQLGLTPALFGTYDAPVMAIAMLVALWASVHVTHAEFSIGRPYRRLTVALVVVTVIAALTANPFVSTHYVAPLTVLFVGFNVGYQLKSTISVYLQKRRAFHALANFLSWGALGLLASPDMVSWLGFGEIAGGLRGASLGLIVIAVFQSAVLSRDHHLSRRNTVRLNTELAARVDLLQSKNQEVQVLNEELRRQIAARSEQLAQALGRLTSPTASRTRVFDAGAVVDGRYRIVREIGAGGMGTVYEVERVSDGRPLALKVLSSMGGSAEMTRFAREAQIVAQLSHPNIVSIVDVDVAASGFFYIVMELISGLSLRQQTERYKDVAWAAGVLRQIALGLAAIHARGVVHRDLKPANVLVTSPDDATLPHVKIADFGVSSAYEFDANDVRTVGAVPVARPPSILSSSSSSLPPPSSSSASLSSPSGPLTETGVLIGTPKYMAPELASGARAAKPSSDIFSFGVIAYELLTGEAPFTEPLALRKLGGHGSSDPPARIRVRCPAIDEAIASVLEQCIAENPEQRPTASDIAEALSGPWAPRNASAP